MIRDFNFFKGYVYLGEIDLPMVRRMAGRTIAQDHLVSIEQIAQSVRMRWISSNINDFEFRVYTDLPIADVERIVTRTISPLLYEPNNEENRGRLTTLLEERFHRAYITN